jgi:SAM-dependent methyltransferase
MSQQQPADPFWEKMASRYPLPFADGKLAESRRLFALVESMGVVFSGATVLDIGCGTGVHSLPLAQCAAHVTAVDSSPAMLARLEGELVSREICNITAVQGAWQDISVADRGWEKTFDVVWAAMTPAIRTAEDLRKLRACSRQWCVYIGWGRVRQNDFLAEVFDRHGLRFGPPPGAAAVQRLLADQGISSKIDYLSTEWEWQGGAGEASDYAAGFLANAGAEVKPDIIAGLVHQYTRSGQVQHRTLAEMGVIVWTENRTL